MTTTPAHRRPGAVLFHCLLWLTPRRFRRRFGGEMFEVFAQRRLAEEQRAGRWAVAALWIRTALDLAWSGIGARVVALRRLWPQGPQRQAVLGCPPNSQQHSQRESALMGKLIQDLQFGWRNLRQSPGFAAVAILTLGLGIGANTAVFSVLDAMLLKPLPFPAPERLVTLWEVEGSGSPSITSFATFEDWQKRTRLFDGIAVRSHWMPSVAGSGQPERLEGLRVSHDFFGVLGARPALGRDFLPEEDVRGKHHVVIVSYSLWQRRLGGDSQILGKAILLDGLPYTVVGVLPRDLESPFSTSNYKPAEIFAPLAYNAGLPYACRTCRHLTAVARLRPGVTLTQARVAMSSLSRALVAEHPLDYEKAGAAVIPLEENLVGDYRRSVWLLMGAVGLVLVIACANVTSLLLARSQRRLGEMAIRTAVGATRARMVRQLLTESALLHLLGGALGALLAVGGVRALVRISPPNVPRLNLATVDARVLVATFAVSLLCGLGFGLLPALRCSLPALRGALAKAGAGAVLRRRRLDGFLVTCDVALALLLLIGAGLVLQSLFRLFAVDPGFDPRHLLTAEISVSGPQYAAEAKIAAFYRAVLERVQAVPGVEAAAVASQLPLGGNFDGYGIAIADRPHSAEKDLPGAQRFAVSAGYCRAMRIPVLRGRDISDRDRAGAPAVVLINRTFAARLWPGKEALGKQLRLGDPQGSWRTVVGIVGDVRHQGLDSPSDLQLYLPEPQWVDSDMTLVVRTTADPRTLAKAVRSAVWQADAERPVSNVLTMEDLMQVSVARRLLSLRLLLVFAAIALVLATVGIYGVLSGSVAERTREIGVRMALGAPRGRIVAMVVGGGAPYVAAGLVLGALLAGGASRLLAGLLFGIDERDPVTYLGLAAVLTVVALVAAWLPARRASRLDPLLATRSQ